MKSGQQIAKDNVLKFQAWIAERDAANDWQDYIRNGKLNRTEIARECGFASSVLRQNPSVNKALQALESRLMASQILPNEKHYSAVREGSSVASGMAVDRRIMAAKAQADARVKALEEKNAALMAEINTLKNQLKRFQHLDDHLARTGRLLPT